MRTVLVTDVPAEIWTCIFVEVDMSDIPNVAATCSYFHDVVSDDEFWRQKCVSNDVHLDPGAESAGSVTPWRDAFREHLSFGPLRPLLENPARLNMMWEDVQLDLVRIEVVKPDASERSSGRRSFTVHAPKSKSWGARVIRFPSGPVFRYQRKGGDSQWEFVYYIEPITPAFLRSCPTEMRKEIQSKFLFAMTVFRLWQAPCVFHGVILLKDDTFQCLDAFCRLFPFVSQRHPDWFATEADHRVTPRMDACPSEAHACTMRCYDCV